MNLTMSDRPRPLKPRRRFVLVPPSPQQPLRRFVLMPDDARPAMSVESDEVVRDVTVGGGINLEDIAAPRCSPARPSG